MSLDVSKICRTCLTLEGALLSIYDREGPSAVHACVADKLGELTKIPAKKSDGLPQKICATCIGEINRCYLFKLRCENSDKVLRQILNIAKEPEAPEEQQDVKLTTPSRLTHEEETRKRKTDVGLIELGKEAKQQRIDETQVEGVPGVSSVVSAVVEVKSKDDEEQQQIQEEANSHSHENEEDVFVEEIDEPYAYYPTTSGAHQRKAEERITFVHPRNLAENITKCYGSQPLVSLKRMKLGEESTPQSEEHEAVFQTIDEADETSTGAVPHPLKEPVPVYRCPYCSAKFAQQSSLNLHIKQSKCTEKLYPCKNCKKVYFSPESLSAHVGTHKNVFSCYVCGQTFYQMSEVNKHITEKHNTESESECPICKKVLTSSLLKDHMQIHAANNSFLCLLCDKGFNEVSKLQQHMRRNKNHRPFSCEQYLDIGKVAYKSPDSLRNDVATPNQEKKK